MRSTVWLNRIFEHQSSQNGHTGLKFSPKRENCALFMKIVQNAHFRSCAARFGHIAFLSVKVLKVVIFLFIYLFGPVCIFELFGLVCHLDLFGPVSHFESFGPVY